MKICSIPRHILLPLDAVEEIIAAADAVNLELMQNIRDAGGCDHHIGVCCCGVLAKIERLYGVLKALKQNLAPPTGATAPKPKTEESLP